MTVSKIKERKGDGDRGGVRGRSHTTGKLYIVDVRAVLYETQARSGGMFGAHRT